MYSQRLGTLYKTYMEGWENGFLFYSGFLQPHIYLKECRMKMPTLGIVFSVLLLNGCATGKNITTASKIKDNGESNIVAFTYDVTLHAADKYASVKSTKLNFSCPRESDLSSLCFSANIPYIGRETGGNYEAHEFKSSGSMAIGIPYGEYTLTGAHHSLVVDKEPKVTCFYSKKKKKNICNTYQSDVTLYHRGDFPEPVTFAVNNGNGCYLGHLTMRMHNGNIESYEFNRSSDLTDEKLAMFSDELRDSVASHVNGMCNEVAEI